MTATVERGLPSSIKPIDQIETKALALMTGGRPTGGDLGYYGDDLFIEYPNATMTYVIEDEFDVGPRPLLAMGGTTIVLEASYVVVDPSRVRMVRTCDRSGEASVYLQVATLENGTGSYSLTPATIENIKSLDDVELAEAALLSLVATRKVLEEQARTRHGDYVKWDITDERVTDAEREKVAAEAMTRTAQTSQGHQPTRRQNESVYRLDSQQA